MVFSSDFRRLVEFTDDVHLLAQGAFGMRAFGTTRLHDAVVYAASSYHGQRDRRALVLLSDGADNGSDYPIEQVLDAALRARVMVFPIALADLGESTVSDLQSLADKTGGRFFRAGKATGLDLIYETIERVLRTQYHIVYEPSEDNDPDSLPVVEIEIDRPGLSVQIVRGE